MQRRDRVPGRVGARQRGTELRRRLAASARPSAVPEDHPRAALGHDRDVRPGLAGSPRRGGAIGWQAPRPGRANGGRRRRRHVDGDGLRFRAPVRLRRMAGRGPRRGALRPPAGDGGGGGLSTEGGTSMDKVTAAAVQATPVFLQRDATVDKAVRLIRDAAANGAGLIVFPETFVPTYPDWVWRAGVWDDTSEALYGRLYQESVVVPSPATDAL